MITWRNINAPDLSGVAQLQQAGAANLNASIDALQSLAAQRRDINIQQEQEQKKANTFTLLEEIRNTTNMDEYAELSLNNLLSSVGGNADEEAVYNALLKQDDEIFQQMDRENQLKQDEVALVGAQITNETNQFRLDDMVKQASEAEKNKAITNAASTYGMDIYNSALVTTDRDIQDLATRKGKNLGYSGTQLETFVNQTVKTAKDMRTIKEDESPYVQLASQTVDTTYNNVVAQADEIKNRIYNENPIVPVFDVYKDISTTSQAISDTVDKFPSGWIFGSDRGANLKGRIEDTANRFIKDNKLDTLPPEVLAASLKIGEGVQINEELLGNDKADISNLYRTIQKYYDMYQMNEVRKKNRRSADENYYTTINQAANKREQGMLDILNAKGNIDNLTTMIKSYQ